ncbi:hypothetical protein QBC44DRAFT_247391 [Cladorrhinum sp. PSN332]|nr:hypothetical protein QBC44DRAFT_247391 [Cladorrhinum sp. PSN332]
MRHGSQGRRRFTRGKFGNTEPRPENKFLTTGPPPHVDSPFRIPLHRHCYPTVQTPNPPSTFEEEWIPSLCYNTTTITAASQTSEEEQKEKEICTFTRDVPPPCFDAEHRQWRKIHSVSVITTLPAMKRLARLGGLDTLLKNEHGRDPSGGGTVGLPPGVYEIKGIEGKGLGTVARQFIRAGTEVMNDAPLIMVDDLAVKALKQEPMQKQVEKLMAQAVGELAEDLRTHFGQLSGRFSVEDHDDGWETKIFGKNAFLVKVKLGGYDDDGEEQKENEGRRAFHAVFRDVSRINHDCSPNMGYYFDQKTLTLRVIAARDIHPGEEMTIGYVDLTKPCPVRQKLLNQSWGFPCTCRRCTLPPYQKEESNSRAEQIHALRKELDSYSALGASPEKAELLITLYELEGIQARIYEAYYRAAVEWNGVGNAAKAAKHARLCLDRGLSLRSEDSPFLSSMRLLVQDPKEHWSWRFRVNLKDARGDKAR